MKTRDLIRTATNLPKNVLFRVPKRVSDRRHIFVLGIPRSGTTLLKSLLAAHPEIGGSDYESTGILGIRDIFSYGLGELTPAHVQELLRQSRDIVDFYDRIADQLLTRNGKRIFVDKLQMRSYRLRYVRRYFPDSVFLNIVRDGRDCFCSAQHHPNIPQSKSTSSFASYWAKGVKMPSNLIPADRLYELKYEDLTADPAEVLGKAMAHIGIPFSQDQIRVERYAATTSIKKTEVHQNLSRPITTARRERWRSELSPADNELFVRMAGPMLAKFGYSVDGVIDGPDS